MSLQSLQQNNKEKFDKDFNFNVYEQVGSEDRFRLIDETVKSFIDRITEEVYKARDEDMREKVKELKNYVDSEKESQRNTSRSGALDGTSQIINELFISLTTHDK
jgi:hypothetical protein